MVYAEEKDKGDPEGREGIGGCRYAYLGISWSEMSCYD